MAQPPNRLGLTKLHVLQVGQLANLVTASSKLHSRYSLQSFEPEEKPLLLDLGLSHEAENNGFVRRSLRSHHDEQRGARRCSLGTWIAIIALSVIGGYNLVELIISKCFVTLYGTQLTHRF